MLVFLKKGFLLLLVAWLLVSSIGFSWAQSTCIFTGVQKSSWSSKVRCCGKTKSGVPVGPTTLTRASCCHYKHFQVKQQASVFQKTNFHSIQSASFFTSAIYTFASTNWVDFRADFNELPKPLRQSSRRAFLQIYLI